MDLLIQMNQVIQVCLPWEVVFPLGLEIEPCGLERVRLLLDRVPDHLPETFGNGEAQVAGRDLRRVNNAAPEKD